MAVLASKRGTSEMEFYRKAVEIRKNAVALLMRDFGVKLPNTLDVNTVGTKWFIDFERNRIATMCANLVEYIVKANNIYAHTQTDYEQRRAFQNLAIAECYNLLEEFAHIAEVLPFDKLGRALEGFVENCNEEIKILKSWRKKQKRVNFEPKKQGLPVVQTSENSSEYKQTTETDESDEKSELGSEDFFDGLCDVTDDIFK